MKKAVLVLLVSIFIFAEVSPAYCETPTFRKFRRGLCNIATAHLELIHQMDMTGKKDGIGWAWSAGLVKGVGMVAARALAGAYEMVTFPVPFPPKYEPILKDPEFFWEEPFAESYGK